MNRIVAPGPFLVQFLRCVPKAVARVARHDVLVARVVHDKLSRGDAIRELLEEQVVRRSVCSASVEM